MPKAPPFPRRGLLDPARLWWMSCQAHRRRIPLLPKALKGLNFLLYRCLLPYEAEVPFELHLHHHAIGVVVHPQTTIGRHCRIHQFVTIAAENVIGSQYRVILGEGVTIGAHAILLGAFERCLHIGDGAVIGPGALVINDVPAGGVVMAPPGRLVR